MGLVFISYFNVGWRKCVLKVMRLPYRAHCSLLPMICNDCSIETHICRRFVRFISDFITSANSCLRVGGSLAVLGSGSAASKILMHICWKYGWSKENRNYKRMCIKSETSMCTEHDFRTATAVREFLTMKCDLFVDRRMATVQRWLKSSGLTFHNG